MRPRLRDGSRKAEVATFLGDPHPICKPEVAVSDHAEHRSDAPVHHGLDNHIADGSGAWSIVGNRHPDPVVPLLDRERTDLVVTALWRVARARVIVAAVPRAT